MSYAATYACSIRKIATNMPYVAKYVYPKMIFWGLVQLSYHQIQHVTLIYSHTTCLSKNLWSNTTTFIRFYELYLERLSSH